MKDNSLSRVISRYWPLVIFSLPGVVSFGVGLTITYRYYLVQTANPEIVWEGTVGLGTILMALGMLSFFAGLIMGALNDVRIKLDDQMQLLRSRRPAGMAFEGERFMERSGRQTESVNDH